MVDQAWTWQLDWVAEERDSAGEGGSRKLVLLATPAIDPAARSLPADHVQARVREAIEDLEARLGEYGMTFGNVVRVNYHTADAETFFSIYDALMRRMARSGVQPASTFEPPDARSRPGLLVEIEAAAFA